MNWKDITTGELCCFIAKKLIRVGYKVWSLNYFEGYLHAFDVYQGKNTSNKYFKEFGLGPSVVLELCDELLDGKFRICHDNFFTSISLLKEMKERGLGSTGTIKRIMKANCPVTDKSTIKGTSRASYGHFFEKDSNIVICHWNDNSPVVVGSYCIGVTPVNYAKRLNGTLKEFVDVKRPHLIAVYNLHMGGTDLMDQSLSNYRPGMLLSDLAISHPDFLFQCLEIRMQPRILRIWAIFTFHQVHCTTLPGFLQAGKGSEQKHDPFPQLYSGKKSGEDCPMERSVRYKV